MRFSKDYSLIEKITFTYFFNSSNSQYITITKSTPLLSTLNHTPLYLQYLNNHTLLPNLPLNTTSCTISYSANFALIGPSYATSYIDLKNSNYNIISAYYITTSDNIITYKEWLHNNTRLSYIRYIKLHNLKQIHIH